ncbi:AAA family ATPase [Streptomyces bobili]|uniref:AAA family ATPase n=1 Tax=Streptomyces bobili TaxID=67280 RepID=UPI0034400061
MADTATAPASARGPISYAPFTFQQPVRYSRPARIAIEGPSGYGRTPWALKLGQRLGGRMAVIDAERGKAAEFAKTIPFTHLVLSDDFSPNRLVDALASAAAIRADVVVIDGHSSFWSGAGGLLDLVGQDTKPGPDGKDAAWRKNRPLDRKALEALLAYPGHVILTLRTTNETLIENDEAGRLIPVRHSVKAQQRDGLEYEVDLYATLIDAGVLRIAKSSIPAQPIGEVLEDPDRIAKDISAWAQAGEPLDWAEFVRAVEPDTALDDLIELRERMHAARASHMMLPGPKEVQRLEKILEDRIKAPLAHVHAALQVWDNREGLLHRLSVAEGEGVGRARVKPSETEGPQVLRDWIIARGRTLAGTPPTPKSPTPPDNSTGEQLPELPPFEPVGLPVDPDQWTDEHRALASVRNMAHQTWNVPEELRTTLGVAEKQGVSPAEVLDADTQLTQRLGDLLDARIRLLEAGPDTSDE